MLSCLAPMDGITDCAYRTICKQVFEQHGSPEDSLMLWTEFMSADGYCHNPAGVVKHLLKTDYEPELIAQIFGGNGESLLQCALDIEHKYHFAGIELNMGCPSPKIMRCAAGSGMLQDKKNTLNILKQLASQLTTPLSLKTRIGLTSDDIEEQFDFLIEASQYVWLIAVHGRTYKQGHSGDVNWEFIYKLKDKLPDTIIVGNGGIRSYQDAQEKLGNLDGNMIAQSAIGNPRILTPHRPCVEEKKELIIQHLNLAVAADIYFQEAVSSMQETLAMPTLEQLYQLIEQVQKNPSLTEGSHIPIEFRKYLFAYLNGLPKNKQLKQAIAKTKTFVGLQDLLKNYFASLASESV